MRYDPRMRSGKKAVFSTTVSMIALLSVEGMLRGAYPTLPSLEGLLGAQLERAPGFGAGTEKCDDDFSSMRPPRGRNLLVVGDSVANGFRVKWKEGFAQQLAQSFPDLQLEVNAQEGADLCGNLGRMFRRFSYGPWPRAVVWEVLADDLVPYLIYNVDGRNVVYPESEASEPVRWMVENSYFANLLFFEYRTHRGPAGRFLTPESMTRLRTRLADLRAALASDNIPIIPVLLEPAGIDRCPAVTPETSPCTWMRDDLQTLADLFQAAGLPTLDLRGLWRDQPPLYIAQEIGAIPPAAVPIHPNAEGHRLLAAAIKPELQRQLARTQ